MDIVWIALIAAFYLLLILLTLGCERLSFRR